MTNPSEPTGRPTAPVTVAPVFLALFLVGLPLRPQITAIGPLVPEIIAEFGVAYAFVGLLTAIPVLCMGLFALAGPAVAAAFGTRGGVAMSVGVVVVAGMLRAVAPGAELVLLATFAIGLGTAVVGPVLPMFLRDHIPLRMVTGTSAYAGGTILGSALGALLAVPLALALGGWRESVLALSILSSLCIAAWLIIVRPGGGSHGTAEPVVRSRRPELPRLPVHRPVAWAIGLLFGLQSWLYYGTTAWLASIYIERGWAPADAAVLLSVVSLSSLAAIVMAPAGARRGLSRRSMLVTSATAATLGLAGVAAVPGLAFVWAVVLGAGLGLNFTLLLTLPTDISHDPREIGGAAALMLLVGYVLASIAPFALGAARDATGDFAASVWLLVAIGAMMVPLAWSLSPHRLRRDRTEVRMPG